MLTEIKTPTVIWGLKIPLELRSILMATFPRSEVLFPSVAHDNGLITAHPPEALVQRILQKGADAVVVCWSDITPDVEQKAKLDAAGIDLVHASPAHLSGPWPKPSHRPYPYGLRLLNAGENLSRTTISPEDATRLLEVYLSLGLTAVNESGRANGLPAALKSVKPNTGVFVVAGDDVLFNPMPGSVDRLEELWHLLVQAKWSNPGKPVIFLTNGQAIPQYDDPKIATLVSAIRDTADIICSERWSTRFLSRVSSLHTLDSSAALDALLAGKPTVVTDPGPLQALATGRIDTAEAFKQHYFEDTVFGDPLHGVALSPHQVLQVIAARRELLPVSALPQAQRWPQANPNARSEDLETRSSFHRASATHTPINSECVPASPMDLLPPTWLSVDLPAPGASLICLAQDLTALSALTDLLDEQRDTLAQISLHPKNDARALQSFALHQPDICLRTLATRIRASGARKALILDIDQPLTRLFARACALEGVERVHIPIRVEASHALSSLSSLCDYIFAWHTDHIVAAKSAGLGSDKIVPVLLPASPESSQGDLVTLWLDDTGLHKTLVQALVLEAIECANLADRPLRLVLGPKSIAALNAKIFDSIILNRRVDYVLLQPVDHNLTALLADSSFIISHDRHVIDLAEQLGRARRIIDFSGTTNSDTARDHLRNILLTHFDNELQKPIANPIIGGVMAAELTLDQAFSDWLIATPLPASRGPKLGHIPIVASTLPLTSWRNEARYLPDMLGIQQNFEIQNSTLLPEIMDADLWLQWGMHFTNRKARASDKTQRMRLPTLYVEDGFIRSIGIGLSGEPGLSVYFDDLSLFFDATQASRLEHNINANAQLSPSEEARARDLIDRIVNKKITKYNFAPYRRIERPDSSRPAILVVDQRHGDISIEKGLASEASFIAMVDHALSFAATHDILIKTHPDANIGGRKSAIGPELLKRAAEDPSVTIVTEDMNPYSLIDIAEKVFVVSSGLGFEALMAGREVWCFGVPFYSGWGLTKDHIEIPRRSARPSLEQIFYRFYIEHSRYYDPKVGKSGEIEDVIAYIEQNRPWVLAQCLGTPWHLTQNSISTRKGITGDTDLIDYSTLWLYGFSRWKQELYRRLFADKDVRYAADISNFDDLLASERPVIVVWGHQDMPGLLTLAKRHDVPIYRIEDGFLRSVGLGANHVLPYSGCLDGRVLYYNSREPSSLEILLQNYDFSAQPDLLDRAKVVRERILSTGLSKYNLPLPPNPQPYGPKKNKRVLVIGQVEDDASIQYGTPERITNNDLVRLARTENPDAQVIYKVHPDVLNALRPELSDPQEVADICQISAEALSMADAFAEVDQVYAITSLAGFEALMRGIPVTVVGMPFYAGWGLTDDRMNCPRRTRQLSLDELFAGAYILYPHYFDPWTGRPLQIENVIDKILEDLEVQKLAALIPLH